MKLLEMKQIFNIGIIVSILWCISPPVTCLASSGISIASDSNASTPSDASSPKADRKPVASVRSEVLFYYDPEPLAADVYVRAGLFNNTEYNYHEFRNLSPRDCKREELMNVFIHWDRDEYNKNIISGKLEFQISGAFGPNTLDSDDYKLWEAGLLQFEASSQPRLNVHVRPPDMVTTYEFITPVEPSRTVKAGTSFEDAHLPDSRKLSPVDSLYDKDVWFSILWNEAQYSAGMASGAKSFVVDGAYQIASIESEDYKKMWEQGLLSPSQAPQITVKLYGKPETPIFYYNAYGDTSSYHTRVCPGTAFEQMIKPQEDRLGLKGGEWYDDTPFQIVWSTEEYQRGMTSGADSFEISGTYAPGLLGEEEQGWWNEGLIQIESGSSPGKLMIHVVEKKKIPFTISFRSGCPLFDFPTPQGASQVIGEVSLDGVNWYSEESSDNYIDNFSKNSELWICQYDEEGGLVEIPQDVPSYYRLRITGSVYEGVTDVLTINHGEGTEPDNNGDIDGNRGGGGQSETPRVNGPYQKEINPATGPGMVTGALEPLGISGAEKVLSQEMLSKNMSIPEANLKSEKMQSQESVQEETAHLEMNPNSAPSEQSNILQSSPERTTVKAAETAEVAEQELAAAKRNSSNKTSAAPLALAASIVFMGGFAALGYFHFKKRR